MADDEDNPWADAMAEDDAYAAEEGVADDSKPRYENTRDNLVFLVDCRKGMMEKNFHSEERNRPFLTAVLNVIVEVVKSKCQRDSSFRSAVILLGSRTSNCHLKSFPNTYVLQQLQEPAVGDIKQLQKFASDPRQLETLVGGFMSADSALPLDTGLWECSHVFNTGAKPQDKKRIFLYTCDDCPRVANDSAVMQRARDASEQRVSVTLWPLQSSADGAKPFDCTKYWERLLTVDAAVEGGGGAAGAGYVAGGGLLRPGEFDVEDAFEEEPAAAGAAAGTGAESSSSSAATATAAPPPERRWRFGYAALPTDGDLENPGLQILLSKCAYPKRIYTRLCLDLLPNVSLTVAAYNTVYPAKKPAATSVHTATGDPVVSTTRYLDAELGCALEPAQMVKFYTLGGQKVFFPNDDLKDLRTVLAEGKGLKLLGFKPRAAISAGDNLRHPLFLYPSEREIAGSTAAFRALHNRMVAKDVVAIVRTQLRDGTAPSVAALFPQEEELDAETGCQTVPPGFMLVPLPCVDDVRAVKHVTHGVSLATTEQVAAARDVVTALTAPGVSLRDTRIRNPALAKFWSVLEQVALGREAPGWDEAADDTSAPQDEAMRGSAGDELAAFTERLGLSATGEMPPTAAAAKRRAAPAGGSSARRPAAKRARGDGDAAGGAAAGDDDEAEAAEPEAAEDAGVHWAAELAAGTVGARTIPVLKAVLRRINGALGTKLALGGKKADLAARVTACLEDPRMAAAAQPPAQSAVGGGRAAAAAAAPSRRRKATAAAADDDDDEGEAPVALRRSKGHRSGRADDAASVSDAGGEGAEEEGEQEGAGGGRGGSSSSRGARMQQQQQQASGGGKAEQSKASGRARKAAVLEPLDEEEFCGEEDAEALPAAAPAARPSRRRHDAESDPAVMMGIAAAPPRSKPDRGSSSRAAASSSRRRKHAVEDDEEVVAVEEEDAVPRSARGRSSAAESGNAGRKEPPRPAVAAAPASSSVRVSLMEGGPAASGSYTGASALLARAGIDSAVAAAAEDSEDSEEDPFAPPRRRSGK